MDWVNRESGCGFWATLMSNNREGTEAMATDVVKGYEGLPVAFGQDNKTFLSGAV